MHGYWHGTGRELRVGEPAAVHQYHRLSVPRIVSPVLTCQSDVCGDVADRLDRLRGKPGFGTVGPYDVTSGLSCGAAVVRLAWVVGSVRYGEGR
jgi:hypothetical protein